MACGDRNATDIAGRDNGKINGTVSFVPGKVDQAFNFTGAGHIATSLNNLHGTNGSGTIDTWIRIPFKPNSTQHVAGIPNLMRLIVDKFGQISGLASLNTSPDPSVPVVPTVFPVGPDYHHVALTYDSVIGIVSLYLDGRLVQQSPPKPGTPLVSNGSAGFTIGNYYDGSQTFIGSVDELELFNVALSSSQIKAIFDSDSAGKCKPPANQPPDCEQ